ncbi:MAG: MobF family relaxase [Smithella sp.]
MLSISNIGASQASNYYQKDGYYVRQDSSDDTWQGKLKSELDLPDEVTKEHFDCLINVRKERAGFDLCFSAPKSVSVALCVDEVTRQNMTSAHEAAVKATLLKIEEREIATRITENGETIKVKTGNMLCGKFNHFVSRNSDPQLHTHAVILNQTNYNGKMYAVDNADLYKNKIMYGQIYRNTLAQELLQRGYSLTVTDPEKGFFELTGIPQETLEVFSSRRQEILAKLREWGTSNAEAAERATILTRKAKEHKNIDVLQASWQETIRDMGGIQLSHHDGAILPTPEQKQAEFNQAVDRLASKSFVFTAKEMKRAALAAGVSSGMSEAEYEQLLSSAIEQKAVLQLNTAQGETYYSTPNNLETERHIYREVARTKNTMPGIDRAAAEHSLDRALAAYQAELSGQQRQAVMHIATTCDQYVAVQGLVGTGKTHMLNYAREVLEAGGYTVRGACFTGKAAQGLEADAKIPSTTIHAFLNRLEKEAGNAPGPDVDRKLKNEWDFTGLTHAKNKEVWMVDEASMVDNSTMSHVMSAARLRGAKVVMVGDRNQLQPVGTGNAFSTLTESEKIATATLDEIRRQKNPELLRAVQEAVSGSTDKSLSILSDNTQVIAKRAARMKAIVRDYTALSVDKQKNTVILTARNRDRHEINQAIREQLQKHGQLANGREFAVVEPVSGKKFQREFAPGDKIIFLQNNYKLGLKNGQTGIVTSIASSNPNTLIIESNSQKIAVDTALYNAIDHGYAMTAHKAQGITVDRVLIHLDSNQKFLNSRNAYYVDISRARHQVHIYTDSVEKIQKQIKNFAKKLTLENFEDLAETKMKQKVPISQLGQKIMNNIEHFEHAQQPKLSMDINKHKGPNGMEL